MIIVAKDIFSSRGRVQASPEPYVFTILLELALIAGSQGDQIEATSQEGKTDNHDQEEDNDREQTLVTLRVGFS